MVSKASISIDDVTVGEQDGFADFVIRLDAPTSAPLTVNYSTAPSTASNYSDFIPVSGALTFAPGETGQDRRACSWSTTLSLKARRCSP